MLCQEGRRGEGGRKRARRRERERKSGRKGSREGEGKGPTQPYNRDQIDKIDQQKV